MELLIGCGSQRDKRIYKEPIIPKDWVKLVTLDMEPSHKPDIVWDLNRVPIHSKKCFDVKNLLQQLTDDQEEYSKIPDNTFDEIHAYEVLEHFGRQGDWRAFFEIFSELWRLLKPNGYLCATTPAPTSAWAWGDPGHTRIIGLESLVFLSQAEYKRQIGKTPMSDYRSVYKADFAVASTQYVSGQHVFVLQALKQFGPLEKEQ